MAEPANDTPNRTMAERYDAAADRYARWWGPVLEQTALRLLDTVEARLTRPPQMSSTSEPG